MFVASRIVCYMDPWIHGSMETIVATHEISAAATQEISSVATQEISFVATQEISRVATQEFEDLQDHVASQELLFSFSATHENTGNLSVKKKAAHINPEPPRASKVTKLERGGHFGQRYLIPVSIRSKLFWGSKSNSLET